MIRLISAAGNNTVTMTLLKNGTAEAYAQTVMGTTNVFTLQTSTGVDVNGTDAFKVAFGSGCGSWIIDGTAARTFFCAERI
jgi:hypothetical protein